MGQNSGLLALLGLCLLAAIAPGHAAPVGTFRFVRITDTHIGSGEVNVAPNAAEVRAINALSPAPDFVVNTGDLVDEGTAAQYDTYRQVFGSLRVPQYNIPGNHDVRWAPLGKQSIQDAMGIPLYRSFDFGGCHFVLLDSTVTLEHWGHFDASELQWLSWDLKKAGRKTPVFIFFQHWVGRDGVMVDNEADFLHRIAPYNVKIVFCGHGHADIQWRVNGVQYVMERGLYQGSFDETEVTPQTITLYRFRKENPKPLRLAVISTGQSTSASAGRPVCRALRVRDHAAGAGLLEVTASAVPSASGQGGEWSWRADSEGRWQPMATAAEGKSAAESLKQSEMAPGHHVIEVRLRLPLTPERRIESHDQGGPGGDDWLAFLPISVSSPALGPALVERWQARLPGGVQSKLVLDRDTLYVSCVDGSLYALDPVSGRQRWRTRTGGSLYGTPEVSGDTVYVGSMDHNVYALDRHTGRVLWKTRLGGPIFAGVQTAVGIAAVGAGDGVLYGLDADTGIARWRYQTGGFIQQQAATDGTAFYVGAWDNGFYAVEAATGQLRCRKHFGRSFFYSPSIGAPVVTGDLVIVPSDDDTLHAIRRSSGEIAWEVNSGEGAGSYGYSGPAVGPGGRLYIASLGDSGSVFCLDASTGNTIWRHDTGSVIYDSSCAVNGGIVVVGSVNGTFHALDAATGILLGNFRLGPGHLLASPALSDDGNTAYVGSLGNIVEALAIRR